MKILFLTYKFPHAEVVGGHRIVYQRIRYLKEAGHQVGLLSFIDKEKPEQIESLRPLLEKVKTLPLPRRNPAVRIFHDYLALSRPAVFWKLYSRDMMKAVGDFVEEERYDAVISEFSEMGQYLYRNPYLSAVHKIMSCHRCVTAAYEKYKDMEEVRWRLHYKSLPQLNVLEKYEFNMYRSADRVLVLTPHDRFTMQYYAQDLAVSIASSGVDIQYLQEKKPVPKEPIILMTGYMKDPANEDGVKWFVQHVWPQLSARHPEVEFYIVGAEPGPRIMKLAEKEPRIIVTGEVPDLRPYRNRARVFVSSVRLGSGMRLKVMEAMASGLPVVSTALGMDGIEAQNGVNCLVADTPELFTQSVEWLLTDSSFSERMSRSARETAEKKYSLNEGLRHCEEIIKSVVENE